jgi:hypothetical protein
VASSFFFNNFQSSQEKLLIENLIIESIRIYGEDIYYIPRNINNLDKLYYTDDQSSYDRAVLIEMYIKSIDGFAGDGNFMSKFGLEIRDQVVFSVAQRVFNEEISGYTTDARPNEGDLIYFPLNKKCFQVKYVNKFEMFYQLGGLQTWEMTCELFEYSNEIFNTGIEDIDAIQVKFDTNIISWSVLTETDEALLTEDSDYIVSEKYDLEVIDPTTSNKIIRDESAEFIDFSETDPFSEGEIP